MRYLKHKWLVFLLSYSTGTHKMPIGGCKLDWLEKSKLDFKSLWRKSSGSKKEEFIDWIIFLYFGGIGIGPEHKMIISYLLQKASKQSDFKKILGRCYRKDKYLQIEKGWYAIDIIYFCYKAKRREAKNVS